MQLYVLYIAADVAGFAALEVEVTMTTLARSFQPLLALGAGAAAARGHQPRQGRLRRAERAAAAAALLRSGASCCGKGAVYSRTTTLGLPAGPVVGLAARGRGVDAAAGGGRRRCWRFPGDLMLLAYLLGLVRFFTVMAALDTGSASRAWAPAARCSSRRWPSRRCCWRWRRWPAGAAAFALGMYRGDHGRRGLAQAGRRCCWWRRRLLVVFLAENCRIPVDDPNTHLELTMIHEVMVLDHSGPDLALHSVRRGAEAVGVGALLVGSCMPVRTGWAGWTCWRSSRGMFVLAAVVGVIESTMARLRLLRVPQLLVAARASVVAGLVLVLR